MARVTPKGDAGGVTAGIGARVAKGLAVPELLSDGYERMLAVAQRLQAGVGAVALLAIWVLPGDTITRRDQLTVTALLAGLYLPWTIVTPHLALLTQGPVGRVLNLTLDLFAIASFAIVIPSTRAAVMFAYVLVIAYHAYVSGRAAGLGMCASTLVLVVLAERMAPVDDRTDGFTLVMYGVVMLALAVMVDALAAERRRTTRHLGRLHRAIAALDHDPTLSATTDSIAEAARVAVDAVSVAVFLRPDDAADLRIAGHSRFPTDASDVLRVAVRNPAGSPTGVAMATGRPVSVPDIHTDERFAALVPAFERYGAASLVSIPLGPPSNPIGVLNAYFANVAAFDEDDVHLLTAYARQASTIVARALAFDQERAAATRLAQADQLKSDFVSTVSHELRTPLTSICGFVDTVLLQWERIGDGEKKELLERTAWNAAELRRLIEQVLAFSALEASGSVGGLVRYELRAGISELASHMAPAMRDCPILIDIPTELIVLANTEAIHQVVGNLLTNAAKFSPAGSPVRVVGRAEDGIAHVSVIDEGPGIPTDEQERIFERFYRSTTTQHTRGTGIGLAIVRTTVEAIGGTISVTSTPGDGASFDVRLPLADARAEPNRLLVG